MKWSTRQGRPTRYFEVFGNRAIDHNGWIAASRLANPWEPNREQLDPDKAKWELYNIEEDFSEARDLAAQEPQKLQQLQELWWAKAGRNQVLPFKNRSWLKTVSGNGLFWLMAKRLLVACCQKHCMGFLRLIKA